jgi:sodium-dependent dicarboxylate transporter 2/3/5
VRAALGLATALLSMWISNTATAAMMLPVALGLLAALAGAGAQESPRGLLLTVAYAASIGGVATPVGTPPNLITLGLLERLGGVKLGFLAFMAVGVPLALVLLAVQLGLARWLLPPGRSAAGLWEHVVLERRKLPPWGAGQWACAAAFALAVALWLFPGVVAAARVPESSLLARAAERLPESVVALLAAGVLFAWPLGGGRRALTWREGARIDFGTLLLFGGGLSLGKMMFDTKLAETWGRALVAWTGVDSLWGLTAVALLVALVLTELASNTASVAMLGPLVLALARDLQVPVVPPLLAVNFGASLGFALPISTPPNAIVYGTGRIPLPAMLRLGLLLDLSGCVVIFLVLRLLCPLLGWA